MTYPTLHTARLVLRMPDPSEVGSVVAYYQRNRDFMLDTNPALPLDFYSETFWSAQLAKNRAEWDSDRSCRLFLTEGPTVVGSVNIFNIVRGALQAGQLGYALDEAHQGRGYMHEALTELIAFAFGPMNLHRLMADHLPSNHKSAAVLARLGFEIEGYAKNYLRMGDGQWHDHVRTALVRPDPPSVDPLATARR